MRPPVAVRVVPMAREPVKLAAEDMVCELMRPLVMVLEPKFKAPDEVIAPRVEAPALRAVAKRLVELAVVAKKFVDVALVVVEFPEMTRLALMVDEAWTINPRVVEVGAK